MQALPPPLPPLFVCLHANVQAHAHLRTSIGPAYLCRCNAQQPCSCVPHPVLGAVCVWSAAVQCVKLFPGGTHGVSGGRDKVAVYWDCSRGAKAAEFTGHDGSVLCCHVHQRKVVTGSMDGLIKVGVHDVQCCH